jgi:hypothetical protein
MGKKLLLSLFDLTGSWSQPFADNPDFDVRRFDIQNGPEGDVLNIQPHHFRNVWGVLAAPPCTHFTNASSRFWKTYDADGRTAHSLSLVQHALDLIKAWQPRMWALENPPGRLRRYIGAPEGYFHPYEYAGYLPGDVWENPNVFLSNRYRKKTALWGDFTFPMILPLEPQDRRVPGQTAISLLPPNAERANIRAKTPEGFALAFYAANCNR